MSPFNTKKPLILISITLISVTLITILYVNSPTTIYPTNSYEYQVKHEKNHSNSSLPRVLCLILTAPKSYSSRTKAVSETWAPRCDRYFFVAEGFPDNFTSEENKIIKQLPFAPIKNITPGYDHLTQKSTLAFLFAHEKYINDFDWFIKADDDTYLFVDNLKRFLSEQNSSEPVTFGYNFKVKTYKSQIILFDLFLTI